MKAKLNYGHGYNEKNSIALIWTTRDIQNLAPDENLSNKDCMEILNEVERHHNCENGITYFSIEYEIEEYLKLSKKDRKKLTQ